MILENTTLELRAVFRWVLVTSVVSLCPSVDTLSCFSHSSVLECVHTEHCCLGLC